MIKIYTVLKNFMLKIRLYFAHKSNTKEKVYEK